MVEIADDLIEKYASLFKGQLCVSAVRDGLLAGLAGNGKSARTMSASVR
jgi:hypothetical protein